MKSVSSDPQDIIFWIKDRNDRAIFSRQKKRDEDYRSALCRDNLMNLLAYFDETECQSEEEREALSLAKKQFLQWIVSHAEDVQSIQSTLYPRLAKQDAVRRAELDFERALYCHSVQEAIAYHFSRIQKVTSKEVSKKAESSSDILRHVQAYSGAKLFVGLSAKEFQQYDADQTFHAREAYARDVISKIKKLILNTPWEVSFWGSKTYNERVGDMYIHHSLPKNIYKMLKVIEGQERLLGSWFSTLEKLEAQVKQALQPVGYFNRRSPSTQKFYEEFARQGYSEVIANLAKPVALSQPASVSDTTRSVFEKLEIKLNSASKPVSSSISSTATTEGSSPVSSSSEFIPAAASFISESSSEDKMEHAIPASFSSPALMTRAGN